MSRDVVINLLAFADGVNKGMRQVEFFSAVASLDVRRVEVRREWIKDFTIELPQMRSKAEKLALEIYYSIPAVLFKNGKLDRNGLLQVLQEGIILGATRVKFAVGEFDGAAEEELVDLKNILREHHTLLVTVEGDQSPVNGRMEPILAFMEACRAKNIPVYATFDVGNFVFVGQEPLYNAVKLSSHVRYIHVKDVEMTPQGPQVRSLDGGHINWRAILSLLPEDVPVGIEFPCGEEPEGLLLKTIEKIQQAN